MNNTMPAIERPQHRRNKSASVLKSIIPTGKSKTHRQTPSDEAPRPRSQLLEKMAPYSQLLDPSAVMFPPDHPDAHHGVLSEIRPTNNTPPSPRKQCGAKEERTKASKEGRPNALHNRTKSAISLRSLGKDKEEHPKEGRTRSSRHTPKEQEIIETPKKSKSSSNLTTVFSKNKSPKKEEREIAPPKDKENTTPPSSSSALTHTPIWAEFASGGKRETSATTKVPLNDKRALAKEINLYMPKPYNPDRQPDKQKDFNNYGRPALARRERPKSEYLATKSSTTMFESLTRKISNDRPSIARSKLDHEEQKAAAQKSKTMSSRAETPKSSNRESATTKRGSRVMAAVAVFNNKAKVTEPEPQMDPRQLDADFEKMLESRNVAENLRQQMRNLKPTMKIEMIRTNRKPSSAGSDGSLSSQHEARGIAPDAGLSAEEVEEMESKVPVESANGTSGKRSRPRSKTFTFSRSDKGSSPTKKHKPDSKDDLKRSTRSNLLPKSPSSTSLAEPTSSSFFGKLQKAAVPEDHVSYLRKVQDPKVVEVGKLHKLRLLLRNETVSWVVNFITLGGMTEIISLIHRIIEIEWREDHEDQLLHESLLCLKALCTTDLALQKLCEIETTLFPALIGMLFDPEHKGPSEFSTRGVVMNILLAHLTAAISDPDILAIRAQTVLSYLSDPAPPEEKTPIPFILSMRQSRPYKVWCTEVTNVTKEVFWIFLHPLNVIAYPDSPDTETRPRSSSSTPGLKSAPPPRSLPAETYAKEYFPRQRPPVPAAPYVGGVEWEATNYMASHLDLLNGLLASLPTATKRNNVRKELRASGFEKIMGWSLRTCKEKFYGSVHDGLRTWVAAACADGWDVREVRMGPKPEDIPSPRKSPAKKSPVKKKDGIQDVAPKLDLGLDRVGTGNGAADDWL